MASRSKPGSGSGSGPGPGPEDWDDPSGFAYSDSPDPNDRARAQSDTRSRARHHDPATNPNDLAATVLSDIAKSMEKFRDYSGDPFIRLPTRDSKSLMTVGASRSMVRGLLASAFMRRFGATIPPSRQLDGTTDSVISDCMTGPKIHVEYRIAELEYLGEPAIAYDTGNSEWGAIVVSRDGISYEPTSPVPFRRSEGMLEYPIPARDPQGRPLQDILQSVAPLPTQEMELLRIGFLLACLWPKGPYPIMSLVGPPECGKGYHAQVIRSIVDPVDAPFQGIPAQEPELILDAYSERLLVLDNITKTPGWTENALCRICTGASLKKKRLYHDKDRIAVKVCNPILTTSTDRILTAPDLVARSILMELPPIPDEGRWDESEALERVAAELPAIMHGLFSVIQECLRESIPVFRQSRLTPLFRLATVAEKVLGYPRGAFERAYYRNRSKGHDSILDEIPYVEAIRDLVNEAEADIRGSTLTGFGVPRWEGTGKALLKALASKIPVAVRGKRWPASERELIRQLRSIAPSLQDVGFEFLYDAKRTRLSRFHVLQRYVKPGEEPIWRADPPPRPRKRSEPNNGG